MWAMPGAVFCTPMVLMSCSLRSILLMAWFQINQVIDVFDQLLFRGSLEGWDTSIDLSIGDIFKKWFRHFGRILRVGGSTENIIGADLVIIRQFYQMPKRQIRPVCFIAGIDLLSCTQQTGNFRLRFSFVLPLITEPVTSSNHLKHLPHTSNICENNLSYKYAQN